MPASTVITAHHVRGLVVCEGCAHLDALRTEDSISRRVDSWGRRVYRSPQATPIRIDNRTLARSGNVLACGHCNDDIFLWVGSDGHLTHEDSLPTNEMRTR